MNKIVNVVFCPEEREAYACGVYQYNHGQIIRIQGLDLPTAVRVDFSLVERGGKSIPRIGVTRDGVTDVPVPDSILENDDFEYDYNAYAFVYIEDETSGRTEYKIVISVTSRPRPEISNTPEDAELFREAIKAVNEAADRAEAAVSETNIAAIVQKWLDDNNIGGVDAEELAQAIEVYFAEHPVEETDPTVPAWAKQKEKPKYTADEVGALPSDTKIPAIDSTLTQEGQVPDSKAVGEKIGELNMTFVVTISMETNKASMTAEEIFQKMQTTGKTPILYSEGDMMYYSFMEAFDLSVVFGFVHGKTFRTYDVGTDGSVVVHDYDLDDYSLKTAREEKTAEDTAAEFEPNKLYVFPEMATLSYALSAPEDDSTVNEYHYIFRSGDTPTEVVHPVGVLVGSLTVEANRVYEVSILENLLTAQSQEVAV